MDGSNLPQKVVKLLVFRVKTDPFPLNVSVFTVRVQNGEFCRRLLF